MYYKSLQECDMSTETPFSVRIPREMRERLELFAKENDLTVAQVIRLALRNFIRELPNE
jgi:predicted DNA-binding protein